MEWIGIDIGDPLILLRVYLAGLWGVLAVYALWRARRAPRKSSARPIKIYTAVAAFLGAASYFIGASTTFSSPRGFLVVAGMLSFTPMSLFLWIWYAKRTEGKR